MLPRQEFGVSIPCHSVLSAKMSDPRVHAVAENFSKQVDAYEAARPTYPRALLDRVVAKVPPPSPCFMYKYA